MQGATIAGATAPILVGPQTGMMPQQFYLGGQQPAPGPPMAAGPPVAAQLPGLGMGGPPQAGFPGNFGIHPEPALGVGRTPAETALHQQAFAESHGLNQPQDFKPADDDPHRWYWCRELDGNWTQRSRLTIDNLGDCRWYLTENGAFYAVRLPN